MNILDKFKEYIEKERNYSPNTVESYMSDLKQFFSVVTKDYKDISIQDISNYISKLKEKGFSAATTNRKLAAIKSFFKFLLKNGIINTNPAELIESGKLEKRLPRPLEKNEINKISNTTENFRDKAIIETLYGAGLRRSELISLKKSDINWEKGTLRIHGKGRKDRIVPINKFALSLLKRYCDSHSSEWVFPSVKNKNNHISARRLNEIIQYYAQKSGVRGATPHKFRHSFGTHLYENGIDSKVLQDLMGHESINTTSIYAKVSIDRNLSEYNKYFNR